ncbi:TPA: single-stranded DNA-binding protein [Staphylococcus aureus]|uniref:single-stranded DNA-binding protein n=1 Tax=Staphylococcus TaxID=1279 RepID=UPI001F0A8DD4|nr:MULTISPECIES: single-stranded DNA-binding protein [Staphylococcus]MCH4413725.1 single-stranded DNA-binding protein [Staphylococcus haemolyticus]MCH4430131.1 single-stranded DNA-binding protein [Staphylococcus haemolyticus]BCX99666.1 single-stranded DNA-binding protein 4 [Staphylococcus aureus]HAR7475675.1 single-stranded DNA-binding protein [Staphylococcus aureus]HAR7527134.1 single-stranded DNA-binding protein [Staphylococcus aureus]
MINKVIYSGRIATDLKLRKSKNEKSYVFFNIAVPRQFDNDRTDFINCVVWGKQAESLVDYQSKGNLIIIEGSTETYKKDNINMSRCLVEKTIFLESKKENKKHDVSEDDAISPAEDSGNDKAISDDDLPF